MERHERVSAITQSLPGLESFLRNVLANETLSSEADKQRQEFIRKLDILSQPPSLPPRPKHIALGRKRSQNHYDRRGKLHLHNLNSSGSLAPVSQIENREEVSPYKNDANVDPVEFASKQRELARNKTLYKSYVTRKDILSDGGNRGDKFEDTILEALPGSTSQRLSIKSSSSCEDDIYEHLSSTTPLHSPLDKEAGQKGIEPFVFGSPPNGGGETPVNVGSRGTSVRGSGGKGKLIYATGWFKKEAKVYEEVFPSSLKDPTLQGWLKDVKSNKRRWCVIKDHRFYIFKNQEEPAMQILNLPDCDIAVDDKKKISYSFRLTPHGGTPVALAIEEGHDLSPWMSTIMAAVVRKSTYQPTSPIEGALDLEEARHRAMSPPCQGNESTTSTDGTQTNADPETPYELPVDFGYDNWLLRSSVAAPTPVHSTPKGRGEGEVEDEPDRYDAPLPPIPGTDAVDGESSSSESSSDEDEDEKGDKQSGKDLSKKMNSKLRKRKDHDEKMDLSQNLQTEQQENKRDSFYDTQSEHSGGCASNWQSCSEPLASDDTSSSDQRLLDVPPCPVTRSDSISSRKRTSTVLSTVSVDSLGSDLDLTTAPESSPEKKVNKILRPPKGKKRRKLTSAESLKQFLQDASAAHSGKLYQKRRLAVWTKRYCKIVDNCLKCYRHPDDEKPCIDFPLLGYDITLIDSKESKKGYAFKISHPNMEALYFATDSRNSVERWIEMLSLTATGQLENAAPYLPYFSSAADASIGQSRESLVSSEDAVEGDSLDDIDNSNGSPQLLPKHHGPYDDASGFAAADELEDDASSDARDNHQLKSHNRHKQRSQKSSTDSQASDNALKRHRETNPSREIHSGSDTPGTMSPPHSVFIADPPDTAPTEDKSREEQKKEKEKKGWADALKLKRGTLGRRSSLEQLKDRALATDFQTYAKYKSNTIKKSGHSFAHLLTLFDREGKFSGFLTEIKTGKFSTTHLRRWCVVRNGVLNLYKSEMEDSPVSKLSLVEMYVTEEIDEEKRKFAFRLHDKEEKIHAFQSNSKEDFQKWMGVLNLFTDLRGSPDKNQRVYAVLKKLDSGSCSDEGNFERSTTHSKSARYSYERGKKDDPAHSPPGKRQSLKTKFSQRVNVRDIFRKSHSSYDMSDALHNEENAALSADVNTVNYTGGVLTEMNVSEDSYVRNTKRWCTVKGKVLLVYTDYKASDPIRQIPLEHAWIIDNSDAGHKLFRFRITLKNDQFSFLTTDQADLNRWLKNLEEAVSGPNEEEPTTRCMVRIPSPGIKMHRRTQSETFAQKMSEADQSSRRLTSPQLREEKWTSCSSFRSSSSNVQLTDKLMAGYLQEMHEKSGAVTLLRRWCVATSEKFLVYYNEESDKPLKSWDLASLRVVDDSSNPSTDLFGFCVHHDGKVNSFQNVDHDIIKQWLSVLSRYCYPVKEHDSATNQLPRQRYKKSASEHNIKADHDNRKLFRVFSEGRASGAKLLRKVSDDGLFPHRKFSRPELLRTSFKSPEKPEVKLRDKSSLSSYDAERRFSCGSLFDSGGKFSSFLMELNANDKCRSQVRRWCVLRDDYMLVYDFEGASEPRKVIPLENAKLTKEVDYENGIYLLNILYSGDEQANFRAISRTDLEKWSTVISVKNAVIKSRSERDLRRQSREFTPHIRAEAPSTTDLRLHSEASYSPEPERNRLCPRGNPSSVTSGEGSEWRLKSCSLSSFAPSEDSVFTADSRMDETGIGVGLGLGLEPTGWKIQPSVDSSEGSTDEEAPSNSEKGLYNGESLKDFFELVMSPSDQMTRDLEKINLVDQLDQIPRDGTQAQPISSNDIRTKTNSSETGSCENTGKGRQVSKGLELNLRNSSTKVDSLSPSREITIGFGKINLRERSGSDTSMQDTYFGPPTPNRNSLERGSMRSEDFVECDKDIVAQWLEDLIDNVTQERYFENPRNQSIEYRERDRLFECSFEDESHLESTTFELDSKPMCSVSEKNRPKNKRDGSVGGFLEELVSSVAQDFAKTMPFGVESPERQNVKKLSELAGGAIVGSLEYRNSPITCPEVIVIESAAETDAQAQDNLPGSTGVVEARGDENLNKPKTGVNSALDVNSELLKTEQEMQVVFVSSSSEDSGKDCETDITTYHGTDSELMATERTAVDEYMVELDTSNNSSFISHFVVGDQAGLTVEGIPEAHTEAHISSSEDLRRSVENNEINAEVETSLLLNRSENDQDLPVEPSKLARCENGTTSKSEQGVSLDAVRINSTVNELPSTHSTEREVHQKEKDESLLGEGSGSERTLPKAETEVMEVAAQAQDEDVPNVNYESAVTSESEKLSRVPLSDVTPDAEVGKQKNEDRQTPPCTDCTQRTLTRAELTRSQADCINAVSEAFQDIVDIVAGSDSEMEETKL